MPRVLKPERLRAGDLIGIVAPASPMSAELLQNGVRYLEGLGYKIKLGRYVYKEHGYLAGTDKQRASDLNSMFRDRRVRAIFCARGGYGTPRLLPLLDYELIKQNPKIFVGYSDITALQLAIWKRTRLVSFSGPMVASEMGKGIEPFTEERFWRTLTEPAPLGTINEAQPEALTPVFSGKGHGRLLGGCLSMINALVGTPYLPSFAGSLLFVEEVGEEVYRLDRILAQLRAAGALNRINGFVLGQLLECEPAPDKPSLRLENLLDDYVKPLKIPAVTGLEYGHNASKHTIPIGVRAELQVRRGKVDLTIFEAAVI